MVTLEKTSVFFLGIYGYWNGEGQFPVAVQHTDMLFAGTSPAIGGIFWGVIEAC